MNYEKAPFKLGSLSNLKGAVHISRFFSEKTEPNASVEVLSALL